MHSCHLRRRFCGYATTSQSLIRSSSLDFFNGNPPNAIIGSATRLSHCKFISSLTPDLPLAERQSAMEATTALTFAD